MKNFEEYVTSWWQELVDKHEDDAAWCKDVMEQMGYYPVSDYLDDEDTPYDFLANFDDAVQIFEKVYGYNSQVEIDEIPSGEEFIEDILKQAAEPYAKEYDFVDEIVSDMAGHCVGYETPLGFFKDMATGGCSSGLVGMFIYHSDCKKFYIEHIDSMEAYIEEFEGETGEPVRNTDHQPRYTFVCWFCYEELAYNIARNLFEDEF